MNTITQIRLVERVDIDHDRLGALYAEMGNVGAENVVCRAMEELAVRLSECSTLWRESSLIRLRKHARSLIAISDQIGMHMLAQVAADVTAALDAKDEVAVAATLSRMLRIGERSLTAMWAMEDMSI